MDENSRVHEINEILEHLEDVLEDSKQTLLSSKVAVDKEEIFDIIQEIRLKLPNEIQQSRWVVEDRAKIIEDAKEEANSIIEEAHHTVEKMIKNHEITQYAEERAQNIIHSARNDARELHLGAIEYADNVLKDIEVQLKATLDVIHKEVSGFQAYMGDVVRTLYNNRQELKGVVNNQVQEDDESEQ